jgi:hypothetical protein
MTEFYMQWAFEHRHLVKNCGLESFQSQMMFWRR